MTQKLQVIARRWYVRLVDAATVRIVRGAHRYRVSRSVCCNGMSDRLGMSGSSGSGEGEGDDKGTDHEGLH